MLLPFAARIAATARSASPPTFARLVGVDKYLQSLRKAAQRITDALDGGGRGPPLLQVPLFDCSLHDLAQIPHCEVRHFWLR